MHDMRAFLLMLGGAVYLVLGLLHALYTFLDIARPCRIVPVNLELIQTLQNEPIRLAGSGTTFWRGWVGFNFSHSLGALLFAVICISGGWLLTSAQPLAVPLIVPVVVGGLYVVLAVKYWFRIPIAGTVFAECCFVAAFLAN